MTFDDVIALLGNVGERRRFLAIQIRQIQLFKPTGGNAREESGLSDHRERESGQAETWILRSEIAQAQKQEETLIT